MLQSDRVNFDLSVFGSQSSNRFMEDNFDPHFL